MKFRIVTGLVFFLPISIRLYYQQISRTSQGRVIYLERKREMVGQGLLLGGALGAMGRYLVQGRSAVWFQSGFPPPVRWAGAGLALLASGLLWWAHRTLGANFSPVLHLRQRHRLVAEGPYRWVQHPMYSGFWVMITGWFLVSADGWVGLTWLAFAGSITRRVAREEQALADRFGRSYRLYRRHTGRFWPRIRPFANRLFSKE